MNSKVKKRKNICLTTLFVIISLSFIAGCVLSGAILFSLGQLCMWYDSYLTITKCTNDSNSSLLIGNSSIIHPKKNKNDKKVCDLVKYESSKDDDEHSIPNLHYNIPVSGQMIKMHIESVANIESEETFTDSVLSILPWKILSTHCHDLLKKSDIEGIRTHHCLAILAERGYCAITYNEKDSNSKQSLLLTLFTSTKGSQVLIGIVDALVNIFTPPTGDDSEDIFRNTYLNWNFEYRGIPYMPENIHNRDPYSNDLGQDILGSVYQYRRNIYTVQSMFQRIDIIDVIGTEITTIEQYRSSIVDNSSYEYKHAELFHPNRVVFLDGVQQSESKGDEAYHEALVHPAMFAHSNPKRISIIGGGEGATLREVLKHNTVEHVTMIDIDEVMVKTSDIYLPSWNNCTDIIQVHDDCFKDRRTKFLADDAFAWFINHFSSNIDYNTTPSSLYGTIDPFDVIIMDALDPQDVVEFANLIYNSDIFMKALFNGLKENGILVMQVGEASNLHDPPEELSFHNNRAATTEILSNIGFESIHMYLETHCRFGHAWTFLVACKKDDCRERWYSTINTEIAIHKRIHRSYSGKHLLKYIDSSTLRSYQTIHRAAELVYCRSNLKSQSCLMAAHGYRPDRLIFDSKSFEVQLNQYQSNVAKVKSNVDIPEFSYIQTSEPIHFSVNTMRYFCGFNNWKINVFQCDTSVSKFIRTFGMQSTLQGKYETYVDTGIYPFLNHNCNVDANVGHLASWTLKNGRPSQYFLSNNRITFTNRDIVNNDTYAPYLPIYNSILERHLQSFSSGFLLSLRNISAGEEIVSNHIYRLCDGSRWNEFTSTLESFCSGTRE